MRNRDITLAAAVVLRDADGRVLLVKENSRRRRWGLPGVRDAVAGSRRPFREIAA